MSILWKNNATSALASDITAGSLSITVTSGHGDRFPEVVAPHYCMVTLVDTSGNREIVKVTARESASNTMTIERAQDGTTARAFEEGSVVELRITKNAMDEVSKASDINAQHYVCDASAADQGATANSNSLKSIVDALRETEEATIELPHTGTGDTTTYTVGTDLTIPDTVRLIPHKGVRISPSTGVTLTANCIIEANYQIFAGDGTVTVNSYPQDQAWWGSSQRLDVTGLSIGTKTLALNANTTVSSFAATVLDDANAAAARATLDVFSMPPGVILPYGGASAPSGWLLCYGQTVSQTTYADLYAIIGHTYGADPGGGNFILPDMRGSIPLGKDNMGGASANRITSAAADTVGLRGGNEAHTHTGANHQHTTGDCTLTAAQSGIREHRHVVDIKLFSSQGPSAYISPTGEATTAERYTGYVDGGAQNASAPHNHGDTSSAGSGDTGSTTTAMPYLTLNYIIKY
jgi:microcystin-dependent protein